VGRDPSWTTPSELAEYAFCPRAYHYRQTEGPRSTFETDRGTAFHERELGRERWRDEHRLAPWIALLVGVALLAAAVLGFVR
jgi:CRISPR/Cas system-associated exonuclease Cas4 (RecB family)